MNREQSAGGLQTPLFLESFTKAMLITKSFRIIKRQRAVSRAVKSVDSSMMLQLIISN